MLKAGTASAGAGMAPGATVVPAAGYVPGNVVSCCRFCSFAKSDRSTEDFLLWVRRLVNYQTKLPHRKKKEQDERQLKLFEL